jgi:hypothetical protein
MGTPQKAQKKRKKKKKHCNTEGAQGTKQGKDERLGREPRNRMDEFGNANTRKDEDD